MTYMPAQNKTAEECQSEIERYTRINASLLEVIKDKSIRVSRRDAASEERSRNWDYIKRLEIRLRDLEAPTPR